MTLQMHEGYGALAKAPPKYVAANDNRPKLWGCEKKKKKPKAERARVIYVWAGEGAQAIPFYVATGDNLVGGTRAEREAWRRYWSIPSKPTPNPSPISAPCAQPMRLVILESPYAGNVEIHVDYARKCVRDSLMRGEAPIASHLLYTQPGILDDGAPAERAQGIDAGLAWRRVADGTVVYTDFGISRGMQYGIEAAISAGRPVEYRRLRDAGRV